MVRDNAEAPPQSRLRHDSHASHAVLKKNSTATSGANMRKRSLPRYSSRESQTAKASDQAKTKLHIAKVESVGTTGLSSVPDRVEIISGQRRASGQAAITIWMMANSRTARAMALSMDGMLYLWSFFAAS
jgi:hypothetical protein